MQYLKLQENDVLEISRKYNLKQIGYEPIKGGMGNTNYLVKTAQNKYVLTIFEVSHIHADKLLRLLYVLEEYKFPTTRVQKLANGDAITSYLGKSVLLKPYIVGQVIENIDKNMLTQVGEAIGRLHEIPSPGFLPEQHAYGKESFSQITNKNINSEYEKWLAQKYDFLMQNIPSELPCGLIHGDIFYDNLLFDEKRCFKAIIDFEEACNYYTVFDLGMAIVGLCIEESQINLPKAGALIDGYQKIRILEESEKENLQLFVEYAAIATSSWRFWKYNIDTPIADKSDKYQEMVHLAKNVSALPGEKFIKTVFS